MPGATWSPTGSAGYGSGDTAMQEFFENVATGESLIAQIEQEFHRELLDQAMAQVKGRVEPRTWDAFRLTALEGCPVPTVADRLEMRITRVYTAKSAVKKMIQDEMRKLVTVGEW